MSASDLPGSSERKLAPSAGPAVARLSSTLDYPINNPRELAEKLSGMEVTVSRVRFDISKFESAIPVAYFPIASKEDFQERVNQALGSPGLRSAVIRRIIESRTPTARSGSLGRPQQGSLPRKENKSEVGDVDG